MSVSQFKIPHSSYGLHEAANTDCQKVERASEAGKTPARACQQLDCVTKINTFGERVAEEKRSKTTTPVNQA